MNTFPRLLITALLLALLPLASCDSVEETIDVITQTPELELVIASRMSPVIEEDEALIMVVASNTGAVDAENVVMRLILPEEINAFDEPSGTNCQGGTCHGGDTVTWTIGRLSEGESRVLVLTIEPDDSAGVTSLQFSATLDADGANTVNRVRNVGIVEDNFPDYELIFAADANPGVLEPGGTTEIRLVYTNGSSSPYSGATLRFTLPADVDLVSAGQGGSVSGRTVSWDLGPLDPRDSGTRTLTVTINNSRDPGETVLAEAQLEAGTNYSETLTLAFPVVHLTSIDLSVQADATVALADEPFTVTLSISNPTSGDFENTFVNLVLPDVIDAFDEPANTSCQGGTCHGGDTITWSIGRLSAGQSLSLIFPIEPQDEAIGMPLPFTARADADGVSTALAALTLPTGE